MTRRGLTWRGRRIEGVVLDVDGTLTDSIDDYYQVFAEIMSTVGVSVRRAALFVAVAANAAAVRTLAGVGVAVTT